MLRRSSAVLWVGIFLGGASISIEARADCAPQATVCYCPDAVAVVDGHVEVVGQSIDVRIDAVSRDGADVLPQVVVGELITIQPLYTAEVTVGQRVLFGLDVSAEVTDQVFAVSASETVTCSMSAGQEASVSDATGWLLSDVDQCRAAMKAKGWLTPCDDTSSCSATPARPDGNGSDAAVALLALGLLRRARRRARPQKA